MNEKKLVNCFAESLGVDAASVDDQLTYQSIKQWDSVAHMSLVASIEGAFDVMLDTDEIIALSSVAKAKEILSKHSVIFP
jgi:acyl carrier protein